MRYRYYRPDDFAALYAIEEVCFQPPLRFGRGYMQHLVDAKENAAWVAEEAGALVGFGVVEPVRLPREMRAYIPTLEVAPGMRRRGVGGELLKRLERSASKAGAGSIWLHVDAANSAAIRLYETRSYLLAGRAEDFYGAGRDAFIYRKELKKRHEPA